MSNKSNNYSEDSIVLAHNWGFIPSDKKMSTQDYLFLINDLILQFWKPTLFYIYNNGCSQKQTLDFVQDFFACYLKESLLIKTVVKYPRFRLYMLSCLPDYLMKIKKCSAPPPYKVPQGMLSVWDLEQKESLVLNENAKLENSDKMFNQVLAREIFSKSLNTLKRQYYHAGKKMQYYLFYHKEIQPIISGETAESSVSYNKILRSLSLTDQAASQYVESVRTSFWTLLFNEIRKYTNTEEDAFSEIQDLLNFLCDE